MSKLEFIYNRHSVRKFKEAKVPVEDIKEMVKAASYAPSAKNLQNWHFVFVNSKEKIDEMVKVIEKKNMELAKKINNETIKENFTKFLKFQTVFKKAPTVIVVYAGEYLPTGLDALKAIDNSEKEIEELVRTAPEVQGAAAAMENLQLAAANMGYGTCWMTGPNYAAKEINEVLGFNKKGYFLMALTPLGIPEDDKVTSLSRKPVEEILTIIE